MFTALLPLLFFFVCICGFFLPLVSSSACASVPVATVLDLSDRAVDPFAVGDAKALVFLFVSVECPISNSYAPEFRRLETEFTPKKVRIRLIYPNADESADAIKKHLKEFDLPMTAWRDPRHELVQAADVSVTPEAAVFVPGTGFVYRGRIDNRYKDFGLVRPEANEHNLRNVLASVLAGKPVAQRTTTAIGCYIPKLK